MPASYSASATAASLAEIMISAWSSASSGTDFPCGRIPVAEPAVWAALRLIGTRSPRPCVSLIRSAVIIFVRLAIG